MLLKQTLLFEFLAKNSVVEWGHLKLGILYDYIVTSNETNRNQGLDQITENLLNSGVIINEFTHSHPYQVNRTNFGTSDENKQTVKTIKTVQPNIKYSIFHPKDGYLKYNENGVDIKDKPSMKMFMKFRPPVKLKKPFNNMKRFLFILWPILSFSQVSQEGSRNDYFYFPFNLAITCESNNIAQDYCFILCNDTSRLANIEIRNKQNYKPQRLYYYSDEINVLGDTLQRTLSENQIDSIYYLTKNVFCVFKDPEKIKTGSNTIKINIYDGCHVTLFFDLYKLNVVLKKEINIPEDDVSYMILYKYLFQIFK